MHRTVFRRLLELDSTLDDAGDTPGDSETTDDAAAMATQANIDTVTTTPSKLDETVDAIKTNATHLLEKVPRKSFIIS
jgi:hypothetical protein